MVVASHFLALAVLGAPDPVCDETQRAEALEAFDEAAQLHARGEPLLETDPAAAVEAMAAAARALARAYGLCPDPLWLYAWAQAERLSDNCEAAVGLYQRFLEHREALSDNQIELAEDGLQRCGASPREPEAPPPVVEVEPEPEPAPSPAPLPTSPPTDTAPPRPWHRDPAAGALLGIGLAAVASGVALLVAPRARLSSGQLGHRDYTDLEDRLPVFDGVGGTLLGAGVALTLGAVIRYVVVARRRRAVSTPRR